MAGRIGFRVFDRQIDYTIRGVVTEVRASFEQKLTLELKALEQKNNDQVAAVIKDLTARTDQAIDNLKLRAEFSHAFDQGLVFVALEQYDHSIENFRTALEIYASKKTSAVISRESAASALSNLFRSLRKKDKDKFEQNARKELESELYKNLQAELVEAGGLFGPLVPLLPHADKPAEPTPSS